MILNIAGFLPCHVEAFNSVPLYSNKNKQSGLAIIMVLLIVALMITLIGLLTEQQHLLIRRISNQNISELGHQYATGVDAWASRVLHDDQNTVVDYWGEDWARFGDPPEIKSEDEYESFSLDPSSVKEKEPLPNIDFGVDGLAFKIEDLQGRFNLNNLANKDPNFIRGQKRVLINLFDVLEVGDLEERVYLYAALRDWLDSNKERTSPAQAESSDYQIKKVPYYASDQKLTSIGELRFIDGFTNEVITTLEPYVVVLPIDNAKININTTAPEVLASLSNQTVIDMTQVDVFLQQRLDDAFIGFPTTTDAENAIIGVSADGSLAVPNMLQTSSQYFQITSRVSLGESVYCTQTTVVRNGFAANTGTVNTPTSTIKASSGKITILNRQHSNYCDEIVR